MAHRVTTNWLVGLTKYSEVVNAFPWMKTLANKYKVSFGKGCGSCGQKKTQRVVTDQINDCMRILATIPEADVAKFKQVVKQDSLLITYKDLKGNKVTVTR